MKRLAQAILGIAVSGGALWLTLRERDLEAIWQTVRSADYRFLVPYVLILLAIHVIRTVRWGILLEPIAKVPFSKLNAACAVGGMAVTILPFRLGEFVRPYLIADPPRIRLSVALSTVVVERVADGLVMALMLVVSLLGVPDGAPGLGLARAAGVTVLLAFALVLAFLVTAYRNRRSAVHLAHRMIDPVSERLAERVSETVDAFIHGLRLVPTRSNVLLFFALTAIYWALAGYGMKVLALGFGFDLSLLAAYTVLGVLVVGVMIPAGPAMIGTFQAAVLLGLSLFFPDQRVGTAGNAYANILWLVQLVVQTLLGLVFLFSRSIQLAPILESAGKSNGRGR